MNRTGLLCLLAAAAALTASRPCLSQDRTSSAGNELLLAGDQLVVSASRLAQTAGEAPAAVTVISEEQIRASGATTLIDLLRYAPGVDVIEPNRSVADVSIRGFNSEIANKTLVMVDGRSIYQDFYGGTLWPVSPVLLSRIKRIEIVRGPGSTLYGANAFDGVINIITKSPAELAALPLRTTSSTMVGEHSTEFSEITAAAGNPRDWSFVLGGAYNPTRGFGDRKAGSVRDSYTVPIGTFDAEKRLSHGSLQLSAGGTDATADFLDEGFYIADGEWKNSYLMATYAEDEGRTPVTARAFANFLNVASGGQRSLDSSTVDFDLHQARDLGTKHKLVYGGSYRAVQAISDLTGPARHRQQLWAQYVEDDFSLAPATRLYAGLRLDEHSSYGTNASPRVSLVHVLPRAQSVRASYGTSFRNPAILDSFINLALPVAPGVSDNILGNPNLKPEQIASYEVGYRKEIRGGHLGANLFYSHAKDLIQFVPISFLPSPPFPPYTPAASSRQNIVGASAAGFEIETEFRLGRHASALWNYAFQDVRGDGGSPIGLSPKHKINFAVHVDLGSGFDAFLGGHFVGASVFNETGPIQSVGAYTRIDARLGYRFGPRRDPWQLALVATNLFDDKHSEVPLSQAFSNPGPLVALQRRTLYLQIGHAL